MKNRVLICLFVIALCLSGCGLLGGEETLPESVNEEVDNEGNPAYFKATDFDGNVVTGDIFAESKLTVVNVWASYCSPCVREMPYLEELSNEYESSEVQIIGIAADAVNEDYIGYGESVIENTGVSFVNLLPSEDLYQWGLEGVQSVPTTFFVNEEGEVIDRIVGSKSKEEWKKMIDNKLASM